MDVKGQGALEYLLLIGGAVLVAAIVIALITGIPTGVNGPACHAECSTYTAPGVNDPAACTTHGLSDPVTCPGDCAQNADGVCYYVPT